jgi:hypothetical protein
MGLRGNYPGVGRYLPRGWQVGTYTVGIGRNAFVGHRGRANPDRPASCGDGEGRKKVSNKWCEHKSLRFMRLRRVSDVAIFFVGHPIWACPFNLTLFKIPIYGRGSRQFLVAGLLALYSASKPPPSGTSRFRAASGLRGLGEECLPQVPTAGLSLPPKGGTPTGRGSGRLRYTGHGWTRA